MPKCTGCGTELPAAARFCSLCGKDMAAPQQPTPMNAAGAASAVAGPSRKMLPLAIGAGMVVVAAAAFLFLRTAGLLSAQKTETPVSGVLSAPPTRPAQAPVLAVPGTKLPSAPVIQAPGSIDNPMPEDIIAYLRWLKQFEAARRSLEARHEAKLLLIMQEVVKISLRGPAEWNLLGGDSEAPPDQKAAKTPNFNAELSQMVGEWNQAVGVFQARQPPNPCAPLATDYNNSLKTGVQEMSKLTNMLASTLKSLQASEGSPDSQTQDTLSYLKGEHKEHSASGNIDSNYQNANAALDSLRDRYTQIPADINKQNFDIQTRKGVAMPTIPGM